MQNDNSPDVSVGIGDILSNGFALGMRNFLGLLGTLILFVLTVWIPYVNIGTFIALQDIVPKMSRGEQIRATDIFDAKYRSSIGEFFLLAGLYYAGIVIGALFMGIGALVVGISWMFAMPLFVSHGIGPIEALRMSSRATHGHKATIFFALLTLEIIVLAATWLSMQVDPTVGTVVAGIILLLLAPSAVGMSAYLYGRLTPAVALDNPLAERIVAAAGVPMS